ncbi:hypothetical protein ACOSQ3_019685 [Xanthoceras sorbifolium]
MVEIFLGNLIGTLPDIDLGATGDFLGKFMCMRLNIDINRLLKMLGHRLSKPLPRATSGRGRGQSNTKYVPQRSNIQDNGGGDILSLADGLGREADNASNVLSPPFTPTGAAISPRNQEKIPPVTNDDVDIVVELLQKDFSDDRRLVQGSARRAG